MSRQYFDVSVNSNNQVKIHDNTHVLLDFILEKIATHLLRKHDSTVSSTGGLVSLSGY